MSILLPAVVEHPRRCPCHPRQLGCALANRASDISTWVGWFLAQIYLHFLVHWLIWLPNICSQLCWEANYRDSPPKYSWHWGAMLVSSPPAWELEGICLLGSHSGRNLTVRGNLFPNSPLKALSVLCAFHHALFLPGQCSFFTCFCLVVVFPNSLGGLLGTGKNHCGFLGLIVAYLITQVGDLALLQSPLLWCWKGAEDLQVGLGFLRASGVLAADNWAAYSL